jgi:restriction system protein
MVAVRNGGQNVQKAAREWLPVVRRAIISYFASCPEAMFRMPSRGFEKLIAELWRNEGFEVTLTPETRDGGYDILAVRHKRITGDEVFLVECKRYARNRKITVGLIRSLIGVVRLGNATKGMLVTTSQLTGPAKTLVTSNSSRLMAHDYETLVEWLNVTFAA